MKFNDFSMILKQIWISMIFQELWEPWNPGVAMRLTYNGAEDKHDDLRVSDFLAKRNLPNDNRLPLNKTKARYLTLAEQGLGQWEKALHMLRFLSLADILISQW